LRASFVFQEGTGEEPAVQWKTEGATYHELGGQEERIRRTNFLSATICVTHLLRPDDP